MKTVEILLLAADALVQLSATRHAATRPPIAVWKPAARAANLAEARALVPHRRAAAVGLLRLGALLLPFEPELPPGWELPDWPARRERGEPCDGLAELTSIVEVAAESGDDDYRLAEELRAWCRDYAGICEEVGAGEPRPGGPSAPEIEAALAEQGIDQAVLRERIHHPLHLVMAS